MPRRADLELVAAVEAEDGTAVRFQVADCAQTSVEFVEASKEGGQTMLRTFRVLPFFL